MIAVLVSLFACAQTGRSFDDGSALASLVRSSLATNQAKSDQGRGRFELSYRFGRLTGSAIAITKQTWSGGDVEIRVWLKDPAGELLGAPVIDEIDENHPPNHVVMFRQDRMYEYSEKSKKLKILKRTENLFTSFRTNYVPSLSAYRCCPPYFAEGRSWIELIDLQVPQEGTKPAVGRFARSDGKILFVRDQSGGALRIWFDPASSLNPSRFEFKRGDLLDSYGEYVWNLGRDGIRYLAELKYVKNVKNQSTPDIEYSLKCTDMKFSPINSSFFSEQEFFSRLPANTLVEDYSSGTKGVRRRTINQTAVTSGSRASDKDAELIRSMRSKGFLTK